jgi:hypothetical protein
VWLCIGKDFGSSGTRLHSSINLLRCSSVIEQCSGMMRCTHIVRLWLDVVVRTGDGRDAKSRGEDDHGGARAEAIRRVLGRPVHPRRACRFVLVAIRPCGFARVGAAAARLTYELRTCRLVVYGGCFLSLIVRLLR